MMRNPMYSSREVAKTLDEVLATEYHIQAQWAEMLLLKHIITDLAKDKPMLAKDRREGITVLDIGIGDARVPVRLCKINEIKEKILWYAGIDNSQDCIEKAAAKIKEAGLEDKVTLQNLDARNIDEIKGFYDLVVCTYFTAGNFPPSNFSFQTGKDGMLKHHFDLSSNDTFEHIFNSAFNRLTPNGRLLLGSVYLDKPLARGKQEKFYKKCGMTVITGPDDSFTATKEGLWSQRFTEEKLKNYLRFAPSWNIEISPLDTYGFAAAVIVKSY